MMRINTVDVYNFRGFAEYHVEFAPSVTVLIGRNGAGKTSLIDALHKSLSFIFSNSIKLGDDYLSSGNPSLKVNSFATGDYYIDPKTKEIPQAISLNASALYNGEQLEWKLYKKTTSGAALHTSKYNKAYKQFMRLWRSGADLPLLVYYSDSFPHRNVKATQFALDTIAKPIVPRNFGYYQWDVEGACTSIWEVRLCNILAKMTPLFTPALRVASRIMELEEKYTKEELIDNEEYLAAQNESRRLSDVMDPLQREESFVVNRLSAFMGTLPDLDKQDYVLDYLVPIQSGESYRLSLVFKNGNTIALQDLPAGYRRMYSIVLDMACRSYILNGDKEPSGIVMIDEMDLHLHPSLEQEVVGALQKAFPRVQFVITTHSAAVISNLNASSGDCTVLFMQENTKKPKALPNIYGLDYNAALRDFMDTPSRSMEVRKLMDMLLAYASHGLKTESESLYRQIIALVGTDNPVIQQLKHKLAQDEIH